MADREKQSGPTSAYRDPGQAAAGGSAAATNLLRRRKDPKSLFGAASKAIGAMSDMTKKVRLDAITSSLSDAFTGDRKRNAQANASPAPLGVTHAYSAVVTHVAAPLWAVGAKSVGVETPLAFSDPVIVNFCRQLDAKGWDVELVSEVVSQDINLATAYIALLIAKLLCLENGEWRLNFFELAIQISRDVRHRGEYEEQPNDELVAHDQARRKLVEVGGNWRPRGAIELAPSLNALRQTCLQRLMYASVCFRYYYTDENVQSLIDALASQLFLVSYSESVVQLVAGVKGPTYLAKYFLHVARPETTATDADGYLVEPAVRSTALEAVNTGIDLAVANIVHRNDTGDVVIAALIKALAGCPQRQMRSLIKYVVETLGLICCADLSVIVPLLDAMRPLMTQPNPVGREAMHAMQVIWQAIRNVGSPARELMSTIFVAGADMRSFRRRPAHLLSTPYCARAFIATKLFHSNVGLQRGVNPSLPVALPPNVDPATGVGTNSMLDDSVLYVANQVTNIFQAALELVSHISDEELSAMNRKRPKEGEEPVSQQRASAIANVQLIDLPTLFSIQPMSLCGFLPHLHMLLHPSNNVIFSDPEKASPDTFARVAEQYLVLVDGHKPMKAQRRFRLESPRLPMRPLLPSVVTENDEAMTAIKNVIDRHWKYCDQRITDREPAYLHPKRDLSLSHFIESEIDLVVIGGGGTLRRICETLLRLRLQYPGAVPAIRLFLVPSGYDNDVAAWMARHDPLYLHRVFAPLACVPTWTVEQQSPESMTAQVQPSLESLAFRERINSYLAHANTANELVIYQVECVNPDGTSVFLAMTANFEIGAHITAAVLNDSFTASKDSLSNQPLVPQSATQGAPGGRGTSGPAGSTGLRRTRGSSFVGRPMAEPVQVFEVDATQADRLQQIAMGFIDQHTSLTLARLSPSVRESADKVLTRMHATYRGLGLSTRRHPAESKDVPFCSSGTDVLDWVSTTYHLYDAKESAAAAQSLLDLGVISCAAAAGSKPPDRFSEQALYVPRAREEPDTVPMTAPASRSATFDLAMSMKQSIEEVKANRTAANGGIPFSVKARVAFVPRASDPVYVDLLPSNSSGGSGVGTASAVDGASLNSAGRGNVRDLAKLAVKLVGATGDRGSSPTPTACTVGLAIHDMERKKAAAAFASADAASPGRAASPGTGASGGTSGTAGAAAGASGSPGGGGAGAGTSGADGAGGTTGGGGATAPGQRPSNVGTSEELGDHYTLSFGTRKTVDTRCVLSIDVTEDGVVSAATGASGGSTAAAVATSSGMVGVHCAIDGDLFGPFIGFRIRPALASADAPATVPLMSFLSCAPGSEAITGMGAATASSASGGKSGGDAKSTPKS